MNVYFEVPDDAAPVLRARLTYAFRLFCAIYGHVPLLDPGLAGARHVALRYCGPGCESTIADARTVWLCRGYDGRDLHEPAPRPAKYVRNGLSTVLHYQPGRSRTPDWLGEIFEWVSCADEYSVTQRDRGGAPLFEQSYFGRHSLDPRIPYAALAMRALQQEICRVVPRAPEQPRPPEYAGAHMIVPMHDGSYFPRGRMHAFRRLAANALRSSLRSNNPGLGVRQAGNALRVALQTTADPMDRIAAIAEEEQRRGFRATWCFQACNPRGLDAACALDDPGIVDTMRWLSFRGMEIGLSASFASLAEPGTLRSEAAAMKAAGLEAAGGRVHRKSGDLARIFSAVEEACLAWDASAGWPARLGFRAGACFAFPPYNFAEERPYRFLEIPLVAAEEAFKWPPRGEGQQFHEMAQMLATSRRLGWGGIALLWRPAAFGGGWLAPEIGEIFWRLAEDRERWHDVWMRGSRFIDFVQTRYAEAGLLGGSAPVETLDDLPIAVGAEPAVRIAAVPGADKAALA
jgi:hypothetical protein